MNQVVIDVQDLEFRYKPQLEPVLCGVTLRICSGEFVALIGQNGAGKTTLAKHFNGILLPTQGKVIVDGQDTKKLPVEQLAKLVGYCYQNPDHQIFSSTVYEEVKFGPRNMGLRGSALDAVVEEALNLVGLWPFKDSHPFSLGRGQRQLLVVASAIAMKPKLLIVDEPTTGMDHRDSSRIMDLLQRWNKEGQTILIITHEMSIVAEYISRSIVMAKGKIIADGPTREVFQETETLHYARIQAPLAVTLSRDLFDLGVNPCLTTRELADEIARVSAVKGRFS